MGKYAITLLNGDNRKVIYVSDNKDTALKKGDELNKGTEVGRGLLSCIYADFDEKNNMVENKYKLIKSWI